MSLKRGIISTYISGIDFVFECRFEDFFNLLERDRAGYYSPYFSFGGEEWFLAMFPNGSSNSDSSGYLDLGLFKRRSDRSIRQSFSFSLKTVKGEKYNEQHLSKDFRNNFPEHCYKLLRFIPTSELNRRRSELVPEDVLTVICTMKSWISEGSASNTTSTSDKCCHCKEAFDAESLPSHQKRCMHRPTKCPDCLEVVVLQKWLDEHDCQKERSEGKSREENSKSTCVEAYTQTEKENDYNWRGKLLMAISIVSILIAIVTGCALAYSKTPLSSSHPCGEAVNKIQTSENNKGNNRSDVVGSKEFEASNSNETSTTDIKKWENVNKTLAAEMNKTDQLEVAGSDIPEASTSNEADTAETDESEPLAQPVLMVTEVSSTYLEVVWILPEESKTNTAHIHFIVHFRKYGTQWQEVSFLNTSRTSCSLTNLYPGMSYQIYVMAVDCRFSRPSEIATVRTSDKVVNHSPSKGHGKQLLVYAATIIILVIAIASVYGYSKTSFSALHPYGEGTQTISAAEDNNIKADLSEVAETDEFQASDSKTCVTETEGPVTFNNVLEDRGFVTNINHLLKENRGVDVTFELETACGVTKLFADQLILAEMSSYFADEFSDKGRNKGHQVIPLKGINPKAFEQMIRYCYDESPIFKTTEEVCVLFKIASKFKVISLQNLCLTSFRHTKIEPGNVFSILKISVEMEDKSLKDMCYQVLQEKTREVMAAYELCHITPAMVYTLLKLPKLSLNSEYELIKWIFDWAKVKSENAREYLERLLNYMNFLALRFEEFATLCKDYQGFFNSDEIVSIYQNIAHSGTRQMPEWFNNDLKCRVYTGSNE